MRQAAGADPDWLIESKLAIPQLRVPLISRARLHARLDRASNASVMVVSAPAGYGKTVAVASWLRARELNAAWVSVDAGDNDPMRLLSYVSEAVARACPEPDEGLGSAREPAGRAAADMLGALVQRLAGTSGRAMLVLDDLHLIDDERCLSSIEWVARALPPNVCLILVSRVDPPMRLTRLRGQGTLAEIRAPHLAFTSSEARRMLIGAHGLELTADQVDRLVRRTEGWPAALRLTSIWLPELDDPGSAIERLSGQDRPLAAYLTEQVLEELEPPVRDFLVRTSRLPRLCADLCDRVLGQADSSDMLGRIERSNLFLVSLDSRGTWFRYHALFRDQLRAELERVSPDPRTELGLRAAAWFEDQGLIEEAAEQATMIGDHELVARLLEAHHLALTRQGRSTTLARLIDDLPERVLVAHPTILIARVLITVGVSTSPAQTHRVLTSAALARERHPERWSPYDEAALALAQAYFADHDIGRAVTLAERAVALVRRDADGLLVAALAACAHKNLLAGDTTRAERAANEAIAHPAAADRPFGYASALATLTFAAVEHGRVVEARSFADAAMGVVRSVGILDAPAAARSRMADAVTAALEGRLSVACRAAERALEIDRGARGAQKSWMLLILAGICVRRGELTRARRMWEEATELLQGCVDAGRLPRVAEEVRAGLERASDNVADRLDAEPPSRAERSVLDMLETEYSSREIAGELNVSVNTVRSHVRSIYRKLGVSSREAAVARARELGMFDAYSPR